MINTRWENLRKDLSIGMFCKKYLNQKVIYKKKDLSTLNLTKELEENNFCENTV